MGIIWSSSKPEPEPQPEPVVGLRIKRADMKIASNGKSHHTSEYDISHPDYQLIGPRLVVRRGQPFNISVELNRKYDREKDDLKLIFKADMRLGRPKKNDGTYVVVLLSDNFKAKGWGAKILSNKGSNLMVTVFTPPVLPIGKWKLSMEVVKNGLDDYKTYTHPVPIYIIFNPWCKGDSVYMEDAEGLKEYVLNEYGAIFQGTSNSITAKRWFFGQFEEVVLDTAFLLLERYRLNWKLRGDSVQVARCITAMVNSYDVPPGVLTGRWPSSTDEAPYAGGRSPMSWSGTPAILKVYRNTNRPVLFGQCWVFAGLNNTLMRTLGIPARCITNFDSAHDRDSSITIDAYFDSKSEFIPDLSDSVWNFHCWNEVWMSRPDIEKSYGGWQVVDSTPQELSKENSKHVLGPFPSQAIRDGDMTLPYDGEFVFGEVNGDQYYWRCHDSGKKEVTGVDKRHVGKKISTKAVNSYQREDVTHQYKMPEGTAEERAAVLRANLTGSTRPELYDREDEDCSFAIIHDAINTWVGQDFAIGFTLKNDSSQTRTIDGRFTANSMMYTGVLCDLITSEPISTYPVVLPAGKEHTVEHVVIPSQYIDKLKQGCMLDVTFLAHVEETGQSFTAKKNYRLRKPHLKIKAQKEAIVDEKFTVDISFVNPLDKKLTNCAVEVDGLAEDLYLSQDDVEAKGKFQATIPITPTKKGHKEILLAFTSSQLENINGFHPVFVRDSHSY